MFELIEIEIKSNDPVLVKCSESERNINVFRINVESKVATTKNCNNEKHREPDPNLHSPPSSYKHLIVKERAITNNYI